MTTKAINTYNHVVTSILDKLPNINKRRKDFLIELFILLLSIKGRINFLQLSRYGNFKEQRYRR